MRQGGVLADAIRPGVTLPDSVVRALEKEAQERGVPVRHQAASPTGGGSAAACTSGSAPGTGDAGEAHAAAAPGAPGRGDRAGDG